MISRLKIVLAILPVMFNLVFIGIAVADYNPLCPTVDKATGNCTSGACVGKAADSPLCKQAAGQKTTDPIAGPNGVISKAANIIALVTGIGAVIMILIGGFFYVTSAGNTESATKAKARITSALVGLAVVALAWAIVRFITDKVLS